MRKKFLLFASSFLMLLVMKYATAQECPVIPLPNVYQQTAGQVFVMTSSTAIVSDDAIFASSVAYLQNQVLRHTGLGVDRRTNNQPQILLTKAVAKDKLAQDAYQIRMSENEIRIKASGTEGMFYGVNSLLQLIVKARQENGRINIACWNIDDKPLYRWRGYMLDESRHFFGKEEVKMILDQMAWLKLNKFHWHLTDEPGWRMEIKKYPLLTLVGGIGNDTDPAAPAQYYTQDEIREIIAYAAERFIEVIPEIDMPGHATAANRAYPKFSGGGSERYPDFTFNPGKEETYQYLNNILKEVSVLFPANKIHLGGDEVSFGIEGWNNLPEIKELMKRKNLNGLNGVERYFFERMTDSALQRFDKVLAWDEMADGSLPAESAVIMWWRHDKPEQLTKAFDKNYDVVLCPRVPLYFDFVQDDLAIQGRRWKGNFAQVEKVYHFTADDYSEVRGNEQHVLGIQANLWTETIQTKRRLEYMTFPRLAAMAEAAWTQKENKNYDRFLNRLKDEIDLYKRLGIYHYNPIESEKTPEVVDFY